MQYHDEFPSPESQMRMAMRRARRQLPEDSLAPATVKRCSRIAIIANSHSVKPRGRHPNATMTCGRGRPPSNPPAFEHRPLIKRMPPQYGGRAGCLVAPHHTISHRLLEFTRRHNDVLKLLFAGVYINLGPLQVISYKPLKPASFQEYVSEEGKAYLKS